MDEQNVKNEKKKELLNIYWFLLMVMAAVSLVNLLAISTDSMKAAAIVNVVLLFAIPLTFVLGYIDFRNFAPMSVKKRNCVRRDGGHRAFYLAHSLQRPKLHVYAGLHRRKHLYHMGVGVCGVVPCNRFHLPNSDVSEFPQQKKTNEILLRDGDCVDCQLRVPDRVQLQHDGYDILGAAETYGDSGRLRR